MPEISHLWANKAQDYARNSGNFSFDKEYIYSYRTKIGKYSHNTGFVLLNKSNYNPTTRRHQGYVENAVETQRVVNIKNYRNGYEFNVADVMEAFKYDYELIAKKLAKATKPQKYIAEFENLKSNVRLYVKYLEACRALHLTADDEHATEEQLDDFVRLWSDCHMITESPDAKKGMQEYIAGKEAKEQARKEKLILRILREEFLYSVKAWKAHLRDEEGGLINVRHTDLFRDETDFVRLSKDGLFFETHRGAKIKKSEGLAMFRILTAFIKEQTQAPTPMFIGSYTVDYIRPNGDCKIGCHKFTYKEFEAVYKGLKNKQENETLKIN